MKDKLTIEIDAKKLYDTMTDLGGKVDTLIKHAEETNGKVKKNCADIEVLKNFKTKAAVFIGGITVVATMIGNLIISNLKIF